jgi:hypothetical protein
MKTRVEVTSRVESMMYVIRGIDRQKLLGQLHNYRIINIKTKIISTQMLNSSIGFVGRNPSSKHESIQILARIPLLDTEITEHWVRGPQLKTQETRKYPVSASDSVGDWHN